MYKFVCEDQNIKIKQNHVSPLQVEESLNDMDFQLSLDLYFADGDYMYECIVFYSFLYSILVEHIVWLVKGKCVDIYINKTFLHYKPVLEY